MSVHQHLFNISQWLGVEEIPCTECGTVTNVRNVDIEEIIKNTRYGPRTSWHAHCPECDNYMKKLPSEATRRIWYKKQMVEIAAMTTDELSWLIKVDHEGIRNSDARKYVEIVLLSRLQDTPPPNEYFMTKKEEKAIAYVQKLHLDIAHYDALRLDAQQDIIANWNKYDSTEMEHIERNIKKWGKKVNNFQNKLTQNHSLNSAIEDRDQVAMF